MILDILFNTYKIKFSILDKIIEERCSDIRPNSKVRVFINIEWMLNSLITPDIEKYFCNASNDKILQFVANLINVISHYRLFFSKHRLFSKIYLYISHPFDIIYKNSTIIPEYRALYKYRFSQNMNSYHSNKVFDEGISLTKTILEYVNNVYLITSDHIESSLIPMLVREHDTGSYIDFIITKDIYEYQYVNKNFYIIRPKRDDSFIIDKGNVIDIIKKAFDVNNDIIVDSEYIPFILSILGNRDRNIEKIKKIGVGKILNSIKNKLDNNQLTPGVYSIYLLSKILKEEFRTELLNNSYCTDIDHQMNLLNYRDRYIIHEQIKDRFDNEGLKLVNERYFKNHPINLLELVSGDRFIKTNRRNIFNI